MKYPLIEKWLGLKVKIYRFDNLKTIIDYAYISPDELEAKLAEGFEVYRDQLNYLSLDKDWQVALAIGKQPIKKQTKEEAALEFVQKLSEDALVLPNKMILEKAKEILEMK